MPETVPSMTLRARLREYLLRARDGERFVVYWRGKPIAVLGPLTGSDRWEAVGFGTDPVPPETPGRALGLRDVRLVAAFVIAAGGEVRLPLRQLLEPPTWVLERYEDVERDEVVFRVRERAR